MNPLNASTPSRIFSTLSLLILLLTSSNFAMSADFSPAIPMPAKTLAPDTLVQRIALGSCFKPEGSDSIFSSVATANPDVFLFIGDNVYAADESHDPALQSLRVAYSRLAEARQFAALRAETPLLVTWDDHDYGKNDAGGDWDTKYAAESIYEHVWAVPASDPRAGRKGVHYARIIGPDGRRVQFIMLDTRFFRTPLTMRPEGELRTPGTGPYLPSDDPNQNMLGEDQWQWLEQQLNQPADLRIVATSIQFAATRHHWESWNMLPRERLKFLNLIKRTGTNGVILVSGDRHFAAIYREDEAAYPLYELTSSSLNLPLSAFVKDIQAEPDANRLGTPYYEANFGLIEIDWDGRMVALSVHDEAGATVRRVDVSLDELADPSSK